MLPIGVPHAPCTCGVPARCLPRAPDRSKGRGTPPASAACPCGPASAHVRVTPGWPDWRASASPSFLRRRPRRSRPSRRLPSQRIIFSPCSPAAPTPRSQFPPPTLAWLAAEGPQAARPSTTEPRHGGDGRHRTRTEPRAARLGAKTA